MPRPTTAKRKRIGNFLNGRRGTSASTVTGAAAESEGNDRQEADRDEGDRDRDDGVDEDEDGAGEAAERGASAGNTRDKKNVPVAAGDEAGGGSDEGSEDKREWVQCNTCDKWRVSIQVVCM